MILGQLISTSQIVIILYFPCMRLDCSWISSLTCTFFIKSHSSVWLTLPHIFSSRQSGHKSWPWARHSYFGHYKNFKIRDANSHAMARNMCVWVLFLNLRISIARLWVEHKPYFHIGFSFKLPTIFSTRKFLGKTLTAQWCSRRHSGQVQNWFRLSEAWFLRTLMRHFSQKLWPQEVVLIGGQKVSKESNWKKSKLKPYLHR